MAYQSGKPHPAGHCGPRGQPGRLLHCEQADALGYERRRLAYHVAAGNFERVERGLYRLPSLPLSEHDDLVRATFWSRDLSDTPQATRRADR